MVLPRQTKITGNSKFCFGQRGLRCISVGAAVPVGPLVGYIQEADVTPGLDMLRSSDRDVEINTLLLGLTEVTEIPHRDMAEQKLKTKGRFLGDILHVRSYWGKEERGRRTTDAEDTVTNKMVRNKWAENQ